MFGYTMTPRSVNILIDGRMRTIDESHINHAAVIAELKKIPTTGEGAVVRNLRGLIDIPAYIARFTQGRVTLCDDAVLYDGVEVPGVISERLIDLLRQGFDVKPLATFLDRVMLNPIASARDELYIWLEQSKMPITSDGCFLAYKKVRDDYLSYHDCVTPNAIGTKLPPIEADTNRHSTCSNGYHFCSYSYLPNYYGSQGRVVVLKIAPEDVRAIPSDYNNAKGRAATYEVIGEVPQDEAKFAFTETPIVSSYGTWSDSVYDEADTDYNDDDYYDDYVDDAADDDDDDANTNGADTHDECVEAWTSDELLPPIDELGDNPAPLPLPEPPPMQQQESPSYTKWWHTMLRR